MLNENVREADNAETVKSYEPTASQKSAAHLRPEAYQELRRAALADNTAFWGEYARKLSWDVTFTKVKNTSFCPENPSIKWFEDGCLNLCYNAIDRHALTDPEKIALIWESDTGEESKFYTYAQLLTEVSLFANVLKSQGVERGDVVALYMSMVPESVFAMLACARIGAVHCVVFGGFSPTALRDRLNDCQAKVLVTVDEGVRGGKIIPLKRNVDEALEAESAVEKVIVVRRTFSDTVPFNSERDVYYDDAAREASYECPYEIISAEDPLFILYTSGSTGKPKGLYHTTGGYGVYASFTHDLVFSPCDKDIFFCTADVGWITGHSYCVYAPLINKTATLIFEGVPTYPDPGRLWEIVDKHGVTVLYTAPTALRALMGAGDDYVKKYKLSSLRTLGSVGEPINPEVWEWCYNVIGGGACAMTDTWWQTETGGFLIAPVTGVSTCKPGWAGEPLPGVRAALLEADGRVTEAGAGEGALIILDSWPGQARGLWNDPQRFAETYFAPHPHAYFTGDGAIRDEDGLYRITGRIDDVINVSGHRIGTAEVESALVAHESVSEAAVVGTPHSLKGQGIYAYVTLMQGAEKSEELYAALRSFVRERIGGIATPDFIQFTADLPKTRSGKIMRRILRKIAENDLQNLGDISTLANPETVQALIEGAALRRNAAEAAG